MEVSHIFVIASLQWCLCKPMAKFTCKGSVTRCRYTTEHAGYNFCSGENILGIHRLLLQDTSV